MCHWRIHQHPSQVLSLIHCVTLWCLQASGESTKNGYAQEMIEMLKKMKSSDYYLPESLGLTPECKALLHKLLHPDWTKRVKMPEIMADPWFRTDLPPDALNMNERYLANTRTCAQTEAGGSSVRVGLGCAACADLLVVRSSRVAVTGASHIGAPAGRIKRWCGMHCLLMHGAHCWQQLPAEICCASSPFQQPPDTARCLCLLLWPLLLQTSRTSLLLLPRTMTTT